MIRTSQDDQHIWEWLEHLLLHLTPNGMSSEDTEVGIDKKFCVKILVWCRSMNDYLEVIDQQRLNKSGFSAVGSPPIRCLWYGRTTHSNRPAPTGLLETLYDPEWLESTNEGYRKVTSVVSRDKFEWLMFNSEDTEMMVWRWMILCHVYKVLIDNMSDRLNTWMVIKMRWQDTEDLRARKWSRRALLSIPSVNRWDWKGPRPSRWRSLLSV